MSDKATEIIASTLEACDGGDYDRIAEAVQKALKAAARIVLIELPEPDSIPSGEGYEGCCGEWQPLHDAALAAWDDSSPDITAEFYLGDLTVADARTLAAALLAAADAAAANDE